MIDNVLFFIKTTNNIPPSVLKNLFKLCYNFHHYSTSGLIKFSVTISTTDLWIYGISQALFSSPYKR